MADKNTVYMSEKQKVKEITDKLEAGLKELFESEKYKSYLSTMSKFHNYSFNNTLLIAMQKPEATLVAGQGASKSQNELMPFLMAVAARSRQNGMTFTPEETNLIIEVMKQGKSKEEIARIEKIRMMMRLIK